MVKNTTSRKRQVKDKIKRKEQKTQKTRES